MNRYSHFNLITLKKKKISAKQHSKLAFETESVKQYKQLKRRLTRQKNLMELH